MLRYPFVFLFTLLVGTLVSIGQSWDDKLPLDPQIKIGKLDNGLTYYLRENQKPENRSELRLVVKAGSILEDDDQQGLAHFLEHMAFNGTKNFEKQELVDFLEGIGMRFGPDLNAYTSFDETVYMLQIPMDDETIIEKAFTILQDWASEVSLELEEIDKERGVVLEEWRLGRGAQQRILDKELPILLHESQYANRLPIGKTNIINTAKREAFTRFYKDWYRPNLMAVIAVGDFKTAEMEARIKKHFASLSNPQSPRERKAFQVPDHKQTLFAIETDPELPYTTVQIAYKHPTQSFETRGDYRKTIIESLYTSMFNNRLSEKLQQANPPYLFGQVGKLQLVKTKDIFMQSAVVKEGQFEEGLVALLQESARVKRDGFTASELERAKVSSLRNYERAFNERDKTESATHAAEYIRHFLANEPIPGIEVELAIVKEALPSISLEEVNNAAQDWITDENRIVLFNAPEKEGLTPPTAEAILKVLSSVDSSTVEAYDDGSTEAPLLSAKPTTGKIVDTRRYERTNITEWTLSNGAKVLAKPTDFKNDQLLLRGFSPGGHSLVSDDDYIPAESATILLAQSGLGDYNLINLRKKLAGKIANVSVSIDSQFEGVSGGASPQDMETLFQLLYLRFTAPRKDEEAFQSYLTQMREVIRNREKQPEVVFSDSVTKAFYQDHPRHQPFNETTLSKLNLERSLELYRERFGDAGDFTFVFVGTFDLPTLRSMVEKYIGGLPSAGRRETGRFNGDDPIRGAQQVTVNKGIEEKSNVQVRFTGDYEWTEEDRYNLSAATSILQIRLREILREDKGGTYGVGVGGSLGQFPKKTYSSSISFGCNPDNLEELLSAAMEELERLKREGPSDENLAKVREQQLRAFEKGTKENAFWLNNLLFRARSGLDLEALLDYPEKPKKLDAEKVKDALNKFFHKKNVFTSKLLPEK